jgi:hypothetical protein
MGIPLDSQNVENALGGVFPTFGRDSSPDSNENDVCALTAMRNKQPSTEAGPMAIQPLEHSPTTPTQTLPIMPSASGEVKKEPKAPSEKTPRTRADAVRAALARITRRNSLRKQRDAQKK